MSRIRAVTARETFDSRGVRTLRVGVDTDGSNRTHTFAVPGVALSDAEAVVRHERTVAAAVELVRESLGPRLTGRDVTEQAAVDARLERAVRATSRITDDSVAGGMATYALSGAVALAGSAEAGVHPFEHVALSRERRLPEVYVNLLGGGGERDIGAQQLGVVVRGRQRLHETLVDARAVRQAVERIVVEGGGDRLVDDEGAFVPDVSSPDDAFDVVTEAISRAGFAAARDDVALVVDYAGERAYDPAVGGYRFGGRVFSPDEQFERVRRLASTYPVAVVEDPFRSSDADAWRRLGDAVDADVALVADAPLSRGEAGLRRVLDAGLAPAVLVKPDRERTVTGARAAVRTAAEAGVDVVLSARAGDTCDTLLADLAVGLGASGLKIGSLARGERTAKFDRLLAIEAVTDPDH